MVENPGRRCAGFVRRRALRAIIPAIMPVFFCPDGKRRRNAPFWRPACAAAGGSGGPLAPPERGAPWL